MNQASATVRDISEVASGVYLIWLEAPDIATTARPGQFVMVRCGGDVLLRRPLGVHQVTKSRLALLFSIVGKGTTWLAQRRAGDVLDVLGPLGNSFSIDPAAKNLLLVAGGIGIAPLCFLGQEAVNNGCSVTLLMGASTGACLYPGPLLSPKVGLALTTDDGTTGRKSLVTDLLPEYADWADQVFACGPLAMYLDMYRRREQLLKSKPVQVSLEVRMGCGLGICYGCTVKTKSGLKEVCQDGPVFNLDEVIWEDVKC